MLLIWSSGATESMAVWRNATGSEGRDPRGGAVGMMGVRGFDLGADFVRRMARTLVMTDWAVAFCVDGPLVSPALCTVRRPYLSILHDQVCDLLHDRRVSVVDMAIARQREVGQRELCANGEQAGGSCLGDSLAGGRQIRLKLGDMLVESIRRGPEGRGRVLALGTGSEALLQHGGCPLLSSRVALDDLWRGSAMKWRRDGRRPEYLCDGSSLVNRGRCLAGDLGHCGSFLGGIGKVVWIGIDGAGTWYLGGGRGRVWTQDQAGGADGQHAHALGAQEKCSGQHFGVVADSSRCWRAALDFKFLPTSAARAGRGRCLRRLHDGC